MNYVTQLNGFFDSLQHNPLNSNAIALYVTLFHINNKCAWIKWFTAANITVQALSGLSRNQLHNARNELKQKGYIDYKKGSGNQAGKYLLVSFDTQIDTQTDTQSHTQTNTQSDTQTQHKLGTLNKHKLNKNNLDEDDEVLLVSSYSHSSEDRQILKHQYLTYFTNTSQLDQRIDDWIQFFDVSDIQQAISKAAQQDPLPYQPLNYVERVLENHKYGGRDIYPPYAEGC